MRASEMTRLARTAAQLRPGQIGQRARLRGQRIAVDHGVPLMRRWLLAGPEPASAVGWPVAFAPVDAAVWRDWPGTAALLAGELSLLGVARVLAPAATGGGGVADWRAADWALADAPLLWRFHLYYWDWAWTLTAEQDRSAARRLFATIWESWHAAVVPGRGPAWQPYPVALRAWSFCGIYRALAEGGPIEGSIRSDLAAYAGFLRRNLETDVGGNHLIKNLKALTGLAVFFADDALLTYTLRRLRRQLDVQILPDGGHYERAPAYHCQVLGDLIDIDGLLRAADRNERSGLPEAIVRMRDWLGAVLTPLGDVPLLNDGFPVSQELLAALRPAAPPVGALRMLPDTGLARAAAGGWHVLADIGPPCPRELPAHAHADTLGCLVYVDSEPLLIDVGTSSYAPGPVRDHERSTAAHNTLEIDETDSSEVWGAFRTGRRARVSSVSADVVAGLDGRTVTVEAAHDGYRHLRGRPRHHRRWTLDRNGLRVDDTVTGQGRHRVVLRWHLAPGTRLRLVRGGAVVSGKAGEFGVTVTATPVSGRRSTPTSLTMAMIAVSEPALTAATAAAGTGFGSTVQVPVLACTLHRELPVRISTVWRRVDPPEGER
jgi:uncharacterized heparinase superfamily protein